MLLLLISMMGLMITTRLWKWYDSILNAFSSRLRILDIFTWGLILWFILIQYKKKLLSFPQIYSWTRPISEGTVNFGTSLTPYCNIYTWCGLTVIGFIVIGLLRLFIKANLFSE